MRLFDLFRSRRPAPPPPPVAAAPAAASVAKERLQILLSHERADRGDRAEFLPALQREILEVVAKYLVIDQEKVMVKLERGKDISFLEVNVELPGPDVKLIRQPKPPEKAPEADGDKGTAEKAGAEKAPEKAAADQPAADKAVPEKVASDKGAAEKGDKAAGKPITGGPGLAHSPA
ncbi:cell division topological specificity factor MinE [Stella humosa]|uniref:Cell division topological specificity factor n=1 Tax=Stella humosa TaxID=94 RepID=A0A3N1LGC8_9PROT|nr:cell division topological specificity factor MinE [Stella humosa]BBK29558.1 hypothetical protein STHU_01920 [Stella humosa]